MDIGTSIRLLRVSKGIKQTVVAETLDMSQAKYSKLENGQTPLKMSTLEKIADFYKVDIMELIKETNPIKKQLPTTFALGNEETFYGRTSGNDLLIQLLRVQLDSIQSKNKIIESYSQEMKNIKNEVENLRIELIKIQKNKPTDL